MGSRDRPRSPGARCGSPRRRHRHRTVRRAVLPDRRQLGRRHPVVGVGQGRVAVAREPLEGGPGGLEDDEILDAGLDHDPAACDRDGRDPGPLAAADEGVACRVTVDRDRPPAVFADVDRRPRHLWEGQEVLGQRLAVGLRSPRRDAPSRTRRPCSSSCPWPRPASCRRPCARPRSPPPGRWRRSGPAPDGVSSSDPPASGGRRPCHIERPRVRSRHHLVRSSVARRSRAMSTTASSARWSSEARSRSSAAAMSGRSAARDRPATKTQ